MDKLRAEIEARAAASPLRLDGSPVTTIKVAAAYLNISHDTAMRWARADGVAFEIAGLNLVRIDWLRECVLRRTTDETQKRKVGAA
jgi:hypothetical protein